MPVKGYLDTDLQQLDDREHARRQLFLETSGNLPTGETNVAVHNVSLSGMLLETTLSLEVDDTLQIDLPEAGRVEARVVWASGILYGCAFSRKLSEGAISAIELKSAAALAPEIGQPAGRRKATGEMFGQRLEKLRKERGLTLAQVADKLGVSKPTVWAWEKGKARPVSERLPALAEVLGVTENELSVISEPPGIAEMVLSSRQRIADAYGVSVDAVKIMIEV